MNIESDHIGFLGLVSFMVFIYLISISDTKLNTGVHQTHRQDSVHKLGTTPEFNYKIPPRKWYSLMRQINHERYNDPNYKTAKEWDRIIRDQRIVPNILKPNSEHLYYWDKVLVTKKEFVKYTNELSNCVDKYHTRGLVNLT